MAQDPNYIGPYRLLKLIRAGATCQIWEVISDKDNRRCALKALQSEHRGSREQVALLKHEYTVGHQLHHASVIEIYEFDIVKDVPFVALEYFESSNLKQWIRQRKDSGHSRSELTRVIRRAAEGLAYLHENGWIHRDIKPDNFLVNDQCQVKLIDFAIAEKVKKGFGRFLSGKSKIQGTRSYMSPEQIRGETLDERSDLYSFGCMLFELFCGRPPFTGGSPDELLQKHLRAPVPTISSNNKMVGDEFSKLVVRMMDKNRDRRPTSMKEFLEEFSKMRTTRAQRR